MFEFINRYDHSARLRLLVRIIVWLLVYIGYVSRIESSFAIFEPRIVLIAGFNTLFTAGLSYSLIRWALPMALRGGWRPMLLPLVIVGWILLFHLLRYPLYNYVVTHLITDSPMQAVWINNNVQLRRLGLWTFLLNDPIYVLYDFAGRLLVVIGMLLRDLLIGIVRDANLQKQNITLELNYLKSQINPTFLFNTLGHIESLAIQRDDRASDLVLKLSDMMRFTLYETEVEAIPLTREIEFISQYIDLEQTRLGTRVQVDFDLLAHNIEGLMVPPLLLFPFVERAFSCVRSTVVVNLDSTANQLMLYIEADQDNSCQPPARLINAQKRIDLLYGQAAAVTVVDRHDLYKAIIRLPLTFPKPAYPVVDLPNQPAHV